MKRAPRRAGQRIAVTVRGRMGSRTASPGPVVLGGMGWTLEVVERDDCMRFRRGNTVIDLPSDELATALVRATATEYDDDYGSPLVRTTGTGPDGTVQDVADDGSWYFGNDQFTVQAMILDPERGPDGPMRISVHDHHRNATVPWRHLQRIKNELAGPERWAIEWFPPEDLLIDEANERHLFVLDIDDAPPGGMAYTHGRFVATHDEAAKAGAVQAPLPDWYPEYDREEVRP